MKKILVVDDNLTLRMTLTHFLEESGYLVEAVDCVTDALVAFEQDPADLVVSDILMPDIDGLEFCRRLRATRSGQLVPFIFISSKADVEDRVQGHAMGADDYLIKPFEPRELMAKIESQLERSRRFNAELVRLMRQTPTPTAPTPEPPPLPLTKAEKKVFWQVVQGYTNKQIGDRLEVSPRTVQTHLSNIMSKLGLDNRSQLVRYAFEQGHSLPADEVWPSISEAPERVEPDATSEVPPQKVEA
jgi:DNA-binding NarL/FixJ family response regulator